MSTIELNGREIELFDLSPQEAMALVCPDAVWWLSMLPRSPLRRGRSPKCYRGNGFDVHVQPDCRCRRAPS